MFPEIPLLRGDGLMARKKSGIKKLKIYKVMIVLVIIWFSYTFGKGFVEHHRLKQELEELTYEIRAFELRNAEIREKIIEHSSPDYIELVAREELGLVKPGETRYIISQPVED